MYNQNPEFDPAHQKRLVLAVVLSTIVMGLWYYFYQMPLTEARTEYANKIKLERQLAKQKEQVSGEKITAAPAANVSKISQIPTPNREDLIKTSPRIKISNGKLHGSVRLMGARIDDITLVNYRETLDKKSKEIALMSPSGAENANFIDTGWVAISSEVVVPNSGSLWQVESGNELTQNSPVTIFWDNKQGQKFFITYSIDENYMFSVSQRVQNYGSSEVSLLPFGLISKTQSKDEENFILHTGPMGVMDGTLTEVSYKDLRDNPEQVFENSTGWIGITDKYWFKSIIPQANEVYKASFRAHITDKSERFQIDYLGDVKKIAAGAEITYQTKIFAGAKELKLLDKYANKYKLPLFERAIDFGWFYFITKPMYHALIYFYSLVGNFGIAIILLTFCVKLCLFPLARKSYISMGKLKQLHPKIVEMQKRYKEDKMELQKQLMALYKKEKVNPAAGCLPILLQIPIFFSLYKVFFVSIEMRHAPFFGWIKDLSERDPTSIFNLFGLIPIDLPSFLLIGFYPCLMAITMYIQQQLTPTPSDPMTAKMMKAMPFIFLFMFASFPSGLVIYWCCSNILTIIQQLYFLRTHSIKTKV